MGWWDISNDPIGMVCRSGMIGLVVYVLCLGRHPEACEGEVGGALLVFV